MGLAPRKKGLTVSGIKPERKKQLKGKGNEICPAPESMSFQSCWLRLSGPTKQKDKIALAASGWVTGTLHLGARGVGKTKKGGALSGDREKSLQSEALRNRSLCHANSNSEVTFLQMRRYRYSACKYLGKRQTARADP
uniref:Uncharacterized protein n=1 Tax=Amphimedon queenslandica TaxID=400682 RepID=A0A1X7TSZ7_AMPQE